MPPVIWTSRQPENSLQFIRYAPTTCWSKQNTAFLVEVPKLPSLNLRYPKRPTKPKNHLLEIPAKRLPAARWQKWIDKSRRENISLWEQIIKFRFCLLYEIRSDTNELHGHRCGCDFHLF